jgi:hypothetical protein
MGGGVPGGGAGGRGGAAGRRLASQPGGIVGGRPQPGTNSGRPFTSGGSGLVRGNQPGGMPGTSGTGSRRQNRDRNERPDYLTEDEETWQPPNPRTAPPVID